MQPNSTLAASWKRLRTLVTLVDPTSLENLRGPATEAKIAKVERALGHSFPADYRAWLTIHDGGESPDGGGPFPYAMLSLDDSLSHKARMDESIRKFKNYDTEPDEGIREGYWNVGWWPFATSGGGDYYCIDLVPTEEGTFGQIIDWPHDDNTRSLLEPSFTAFVEHVAQEVADCKLIVRKWGLSGARFVEPAAVKAQKVALGKSKPSPSATKKVKTPAKKTVAAKKKTAVKRPAPKPGRER